MKFTFDRDAMIKEISIAQEIITNKSPLSILSNIMLVAENNTLVIKATDSTLKWTTSIPVDIEQEGATTIFCDKFMSILSSLPSGEVEFKQEDIKVTISSTVNRFKAQLNSQASEKFPELGSTEQVPFFEVPAKDFKEMIRQTIFAVCDDKQRYFMTGVYFAKEEQNLVMVATDGHRLSHITKPIANNIPDFSPAIVPTKILGLILKHASDEGNIFVSVIDRAIFVKFANYEFISNLIDGQYPAYKKVIPESLAYTFQVNKEDLDAALKRITTMVDRKKSRIIFKIEPGSLNLISPESDMGNAEEQIPCRYAGSPCSVGLNFVYIADLLKVIDSENIVFNFNAEFDNDDDVRINKAFNVKSEKDADYEHIIMPMNY